jgi:hypothetical protein
MPKAPPRPKPKGQEPDSAGQGEMQTTAIHIRKEDWNLLRSVSFHRAQSTGGRASVSEVVRTLIDAHRSELENEVKGSF